MPAHTHISINQQLLTFSFPRGQCLLYHIIIPTHSKRAAVLASSVTRVTDGGLVHVASRVRGCLGETAGMHQKQFPVEHHLYIVISPPLHYLSNSTKTLHMIVTQYPEQTARANAYTTYGAQKVEADGQPGRTM